MATTAAALRSDAASPRTRPAASTRDRPANAEIEYAADELRAHRVRRERERRCGTRVTRAIGGRVRDQRHATASGDRTQRDEPFVRRAGLDVRVVADQRRELSGRSVRERQRVLVSAREVQRARRAILEAGHEVDLGGGRDEPSVGPEQHRRVRELAVAAEPQVRAGDDVGGMATRERPEQRLPPALGIRGERGEYRVASVE